MNLKFRKVTFKEDYRCFKAGDQIEVKNPTHLVVGLNGSGKSTLLQLIGDYVTTDPWKSYDKEKSRNIIDIDMDEDCRVKHYDFEKDNKRTLSYFDWEDKDVDVQSHVNSIYMSHGESGLHALNAIMSNPYDVYVLDEPDQAVSILIAMALAKLFLVYPIKKKVQIIASVHHPFIMQEVGTVYDLKKKLYVSASDFIEEMKQPGPFSSLDEREPEKKKRATKRQAKRKS